MATGSDMGELLNSHASFATVEPEADEETAYVGGPTSHFADAFERDFVGDPLGIWIEAEDFGNSSHLIPGMRDDAYVNSEHSIQTGSLSVNREKPDHEAIQSLAPPSSNLFGLLPPATYMNPYGGDALATNTQLRTDSSETSGPDAISLDGPIPGMAVSAR
jgi:hypothetical protein